MKIFKQVMGVEDMKIMKRLNSLILIYVLLCAAPALAEYQSSHTGTEIDAAITQIKGAVTSSAGAGDSGKLVELDASGLFDMSFIPDLSGTYQTVLSNEAGLYSALSDVSDFAQAADGISFFSDVDSSGVADGNVLKWNDTNSAWEVATDDTGSGGSAIVLDLGDDGSNESSDLTEIATSGDTNNIFTEPAADKFLIDLSNAWPMGLDDLNDVTGTGSAGYLLKDDGDGTYSFTNSLSVGTLVFPNGTDAAPTAAASVYYNTSTNTATIGDGSSAVAFQTGTETEAIEFVIDGGGSAITTGEKGHLEIPYACTIQRVTTLADQSGSIVVDLWVDTYANFAPTDVDSITASAPPTLSTAQAAQDSTLTGWTTSLSAGDIIAYNVDSASTVTRVTISLVVEK